MGAFKLFYPLERSIAFSCIVIYSFFFFLEKSLQDENTQHNTTTKMEQSSAGVTQQGQSTVDEVCTTDGLAHAGSHDAGLKGESEAAFRFMEDEAVEDTDEPNR